MAKNSELEKLRIENQLYKDILSKLPITFTYNPENGMQVKKIYPQDVPIIDWNSKGNNQIEELDVDLFEMVEASLKQILDYVPHHIVMIDHHGLITLCNYQTAHDLSVNQNEMIGKHIRELLKIPDEKIITLQTLISGQEIYNQQVLDKNYGIINSRIIHNPDGSIKRVIGIFQFLNMIKEAEKQALAGRIAAGIAHEIRNPLTTVRGYLQLLDDRVSDDISNLFKSLLIPEIDRSNKIISDFLRIAKPSQTKLMVMSVKEFSDNTLKKFLNSEALLHNVEIEFLLSPNAEGCLIEVDRDELLQVFLNLFRNANDASKNQQLKIVIKTELVERFISIQFIDNGIGIKPSILPMIFDPFFSTKDDGTGLGLSVSKKIIEYHRGTMKVKSNEFGTTFTIKLPLKG
ncbi:ATP-binding protein [Litchfieldia alkalitelluris]|uniref:ATP-binding protein n=1 Tax=Litchfieldia alkalitelluris TaxID=304268 RepID=UPI0009967CBE|nr:ATP-binding protein [Litchfieldia alkalitelluris]